MIKVTWQTILKEFEEVYTRRFGTHVLRDDGFYEQKRHDPVYVGDIPYEEYVAPAAAARYAEECAVLYKLTGNEEAKAFAEKCLWHVRRSIPCHNGFWFMPPLPADLLNQWVSVWTPVTDAAEILGDEETLRWLAGVIKSWPYDEKRHVFAIRVALGSRRDHAHNTPFNWQAGASSAAWRVGKATDDQELMNQAQDCVWNFVLRHQRPDGLWDYDYEKVWGQSSYQVHTSRGPMEHNYSQYTAQQLSRLLAYEEWRGILRGALDKQQRAQTDDCVRPDGSVYSFVHWGWGHLWESGAFYAYNGWMLTKYAACDYRREVGRALAWIYTYRVKHDRCDFTILPPGIIFLAAEEVEIDVEEPDIGDVIATLREVAMRARQEDLKAAVGQQIMELVEARR